MAIKQIGVAAGGDTKEFMATESTTTDLAVLNSEHLNVGIGSSCMMVETRDVAFFDGTAWFIW